MNFITVIKALNFFFKYLSNYFLFNNFEIVGNFGLLTCGVSDGRGLKRAMKLS